MTHRQAKSARSTSSSRRGCTSTSTTPRSRRRTRRGYRSRAAFKLIELAETRQAAAARACASSTSARRRAAGRRCCASGSGPAATHRRASTSCRWTPIAGVTFIQADFREDEGLAARRSRARRAHGRPCGLGHGPQSVGYRAGRPGARRASGRTGARIRRGHGCNPAAISSSRCSRARVSRSSSVRCSSISPRSTCASPRRRATAAARSFWSAKGRESLRMRELCARSRVCRDRRHAASDWPRQSPNG